MSNLTEFLLAWVVEDEAVAREVVENRWDASQTTDFAVSQTYDPRPLVTVGAERVLAESESKRLAIAEFTDAADGGNGEGYMAERALAYMALPFADHPDYREEWRP